MYKYLYFKISESMMHKMYRLYSCKYNLLEFLPDSMFLLAKVESQDALEFDSLFCFCKISEKFKNSFFLTKFPEIKIFDSNVLLKRNSSFSVSLLNIQKKLKIIESNIPFQRLLLTSPTKQTVAGVFTLIVVQQKDFDILLQKLIKYMNWEKIVLTQIAFLTTPKDFLSAEFAEKDIVAVQLPGNPPELLSILESEKYSMQIYVNQVLKKRARIFILKGEKQLLVEKLTPPTLYNPMSYLIGSAKAIAVINSRIFKPLLQYCEYKKPEILHAKKLPKFKIIIKIHSKENLSKITQGYNKFSYFGAFRSQILANWQIVRKYIHSEKTRFVALKFNNQTENLFIFENWYHKNDALDTVFLQSLMWFSEIAENIHFPHIMNLKPMPEEGWLSQNIEKALKTEKKTISKQIILLPPLKTMQSFINFPVNSNSLNKHRLSNLSIINLENDAMIDINNIQFYLYSNLQKMITQELSEKYYKVKLK